MSSEKKMEEYQKPEEDLHYKNPAEPLYKSKEAMEKTYEYKQILGMEQYTVKRVHELHGHDPSVGKNGIYENFIEPILHASWICYVGIFITAMILFIAVTNPALLSELIPIGGP
jgi:hypothetical protein